MRFCFSGVGPKEKLLAVNIQTLDDPVASPQGDHHQQNRERPDHVASLAFHNGPVQLT